MYRIPLFLHKVPWNGKGKKKCCLCSWETVQMLILALLWEGWYFSCFIWRETDLASMSMYNGEHRNPQVSVWSGISAQSSTVPANRPAQLQKLYIIRHWYTWPNKLYLLDLSWLLILSWHIQSHCGVFESHCPVLLVQSWIKCICTCSTVLPRIIFHGDPTG